MPAKHAVASTTAAVLDQVAIEAVTNGVSTDRRLSAAGVTTSSWEPMMIEQLTDFPDNVAAFACHGHVTKTDYESVLIPDLNKRLESHDKVRIYYETASDFDGFDPGAMWDDTKVGFRHFLRWEKFAVVTDVAWISQTVKFVGYLMPGQFRAFPTAEAEAARRWISAD